MSVAQVNARIDTSLKLDGDSTLAQFGLGATDAIRALWSYLATTKTLPDYMQGGQSQKTMEPAPVPLPLDVAEKGVGLAVRLASERGLAVSLPLDVSYDELRELAFDELIAEGKAYV